MNLKFSQFNTQYSNTVINAIKKTPHMPMLDLCPNFSVEIFTKKLNAEREGSDCAGDKYLKFLLDQLVLLCAV